MSLREWTDVQAQYGDITGDEGIEARRFSYKQYFLSLADDVRIEEGCRFFQPEHIALDPDVRINIGALIYGSGGVRIGRHARVGPRVCIHSANHDIDPDDPRPFFERGYDYRPVIIGDHVLISADVRILPGCVIGSDSFIAAGATVTAKHHAAESRLAGTPARPMPVVRTDRSPDELPAIDPQCAIVVEREGSERHRLFTHLLSTQGLPQIAIAPADQPLPPNILAVLLDDAVDLPAGASDDVVVWRMHRGSSPLSPTKGRVTVSLPRDTQTISLPTERTILFRPTMDPQSPQPQRARCLALWLRDRLLKRQEPLTLSAFLEWIVSLMALDVAPMRADALLEHMLSILHARWPAELTAPQKTPHLKDRAERDAWTLGWTDHVVQQMLAEELTSGAHSKEQGPPRGAPNTAPLPRLSAHDTAGTAHPPQESQPRAAELRAAWRRLMLRHPALLVAEAIRAAQHSDRAHIEQLLALTAPNCTSALRLVAQSVAAHRIGDGVAAAKADAALDDPRWWPHGSGLPKQAPQRASLLYSPLLLVRWLRDTSTSPLEEFFFEEVVEREGFTWQGFTDEQGRPCLIDVETRRISTSMTDGWITLHTALSRSHFQRFLAADTYDGSVAGLEQLWRAAFTAMLHSADHPLIRILPWPAPHLAACSLRYDIDRPITTERIARLARMQAALAGAPCGSWYTRRDDPAAPRLAAIAQRFLQEWGLHIEHTNEAAAGIGVTHHSATTSHYWQGDTTTTALARAGAAYGEFHASEIPIARAAWMTDHEPDGPGLMLTPLHFPLEGGTEDRDLTTFDRLLPAFRRRLAEGGHAIIATHPDLNQDILEQLFAREDLGQLWFAPVSEVLARTHATLAVGAIRAISGDREIVVESTTSLADLAIEIVLPDGSSRRIVTQLRAGRPRRVPIAEAGDSATPSPPNRR